MTEGLDPEVIARFAAQDPELGRAIMEAADNRQHLDEAIVRAIQGPERDLVEMLQGGYVNFYSRGAVNPYVPLAARGPWIVTAHGAVLHDSGGYGMLGFGHGPDELLSVLGKPWVMANIMTASPSQRRFVDALRRELGHTRGGLCPYDGFVCMNSGSEAVTVGMRISDIQARDATAPGGRHAGARICFLAVEGGFHGRTDRPGQASGSSQAAYRANLASYRGRNNLVLVPPNDVAALEAAFEKAAHDGVFFELMVAEPVMGEGNPGLAMTRAFYDRARVLTRQMGSLLLIDSIQAGLRAHGCLSIVDYPEFQDAEPPDFETYSKAINGAQYPLSVLAMTKPVAAMYRTGVYGNTMTANPRALEVGVAALGMMTADVRRNIRDRGVELVKKFEALAEEFPDLITGVQGTGLLVSVAINERVKVEGTLGLEEHCRLRGMGVIHGGPNSLRFTPHFRITTEEIDLIVSMLRAALQHYEAIVSAAE